MSQSKQTAYSTLKKVQPDCMLKSYSFRIPLDLRKQNSPVLWKKKKKKANEISKAFAHITLKRKVIKEATGREKCRDILGFCNRS